MPVRPSTTLRRSLASAAAAALLTACGTSSAEPAPPTASPPPSVDPGSDLPSADDPPAPEPLADDGPHEIAIVADFGPLPDGTGDAVVTTTSTVDASGTRRLLVDTPAGPAAHHVMTDDEHWWWIHPAGREAVVDARWVHFDLREIEAVGGELPEVIAEARTPVPDPGEIVLGQIVAGHEVVGIEVVDDDEVHLTMAGIERPVVHRRRALPAETTIELPEGALDVADLPEALRW